MGYKLDELSYLHEVVPLNEVYKVTKQLCAIQISRISPHAEPVCA